MTAVVHNTPAASPTTDIRWGKLAAPLPPAVIQWRQAGRPAARAGGFAARWVAYIDATFVRERLDSVAPGEWSLDIDTLPMVAPLDGEDDDGDGRISLKATLTVLGVRRSDIGSGSTYKNASTDAFKRAAVRFGIGAELYAYGATWVKMDGDGRYAKPLEDPAAVHARNAGQPAPVSATPRPDSHLEQPRATAEALAKNEAAAAKQPAAKGPPAGGDAMSCPKCGGAMWDNRATKRNPKAPDFKCRDKANCDGVIWPPKDDESKRPARNEEEDYARGVAPAGTGFESDDGWQPDDSGTDDLPF